MSPNRLFNRIIAILILAFLVCFTSPPRPQVDSDDINTFAFHTKGQTVTANRVEVVPHEKTRLQTVLAMESGSISFSSVPDGGLLPQKNLLLQITCGDGECEIGEESTCPEDCETGCLPQTCPPGEIFDTDLCRCVSSAYCGDGTCGPGETKKNCPQDCAPPTPQTYCGNGVCDADENSTNCAQDCPAPQSYCGDGLCDLASESPTSCPQDCSTSICGNGVCDTVHGESSANCPTDCTELRTCGNGVCETNLSESYTNCPADCLCGDGRCDLGLETRDNCLLDCYAECGNGICEDYIGENNNVCPNDCKTVCGDRLCQLANGESDANCPIDCDPDCDPYSENYKETSGLEPLRCTVCGNGVCETLQGETLANCQSDCKSVCGDSRCDLNAGETHSNCPKDCSQSCGNGSCERAKENVLTCPADCPMTAIKCGDAKCEPGEVVVCRECLGDGLCDFGEDRISSGNVSDCKKSGPELGPGCTGPAAPLALVGTIIFMRKRRVARKQI